MDPEEKKQVQFIIDRLKGLFLPDGGEIVGSINSSSSEFAMNIIAHIVREYESGSNASEWKTTTETPDSNWITASVCVIGKLRQLQQVIFDRSLLLAVGYWCAVVVCKLSVFPVYLYISLAIYLLDSKVPPPPEAQYPYPYPYPYQYPDPPENLQQYFGQKRADVAAILGVSVSTFKRMCKQKGINPWPYPYRKGSSGSVSKPPYQHGEGNTSTARETPSHNVQTGMEGEPVGQNQEANECRRDFMGGPIALNTACSDLALSQPMPTIPHTTGCSEYWRNSLALLEEHLLEENDYGSINLTALSCFDPGPSQPMHTIPHTMPTIPQMTPLLTERQDMRSVRLKAIYGNTTIKFYFPLLSGFSELKEEVSKRLEFERGSFKLEYKDEEGDSVLIGCDEDVRDYLRLLTSLGNQVIKLFVLDKVPNTTNSCDNCKSLMCNRP